MKQGVMDFAQHFDPSEFIAPPPPLTPVQVELKRRERGKDRVLVRLQQGSATNKELVLIAQRFGARVDELREDGHDILTENLGGGLFRYTLVRPSENVERNV